MDATEVSEVLLAGRDGGSTVATLALDDIAADTTEWVIDEPGRLSLQ
jgi:hypothetical protein